MVCLTRNIHLLTGLRPLQKSNKPLNVGHTDLKKIPHNELCRSFSTGATQKSGWLGMFCNGLRLVALFCGTSVLYAQTTGGYDYTTTSMLSIEQQKQEENSTTPNEQLDTALDLGKNLEAESQDSTAKLPVIKTAHKDVLDLLLPSLDSSNIAIPNHFPLLKYLGIRLNWLGLLISLHTASHKAYQLGIDLHLTNDIQLSMDIGYGYRNPKNIGHKNTTKYTSKGLHITGDIAYTITPNDSTHAYVGFGGGNSFFQLKTSDKASYQRFMAYFMKLNVGSDIELIPNSNLYGGMSISIDRLLYCKKHEALNNYLIPGYGAFLNKITFIIIPYLKWNISFLEKRIIP